MSTSSIKVCGTVETLALAGRGGRPYRAFGRLVKAAFLAGVFLLAPAAAQAGTLRIIAFGDSLTAGYNLPAKDAFPTQLEQRLRSDGFDVSVVNAGVSGETTAEGLARLDFTLQGGASLVILELGANDMLRGSSPQGARDNLDKMIQSIEAGGARIALMGMTANRNFGADYKARFDAIYPDLARRHDLPLYPFFLDGVAGDPSLVLPDGLHPNAQGVARIVTGVAPLIEKSLKIIAGAPASSAAH